MWEYILSKYGLIKKQTGIKYYR